jgi:hypothetical protein
VKWAYPQAAIPLHLFLIRTLCSTGDLALRGQRNRTAAAVKEKDMKLDRPPTRKGSTPIKVYCLPDEKAQIGRNAQAAGLSASTFLLRVGAGYEARTVLDYQRIEELAKINGDLGRLGGLLKLWLTNDNRLRQIKAEELRAVLAKIERNQEAMRAIMKTVVGR